MFDDLKLSRHISNQIQMLASIQNDSSLTVAALPVQI